MFVQASYTQRPVTAHGTLIQNVESVERFRSEPTTPTAYLEVVPRRAEVCLEEELIKAEARGDALQSFHHRVPQIVDKAGAGRAPRVGPQRQHLAGPSSDGAVRALPWGYTVVCASGGVC